MSKCAELTVQMHYLKNLLLACIIIGVVLCGSPKNQPRRSSIVQFLIFFLSFEISGNILRNQKILYV